MKFNKSILFTALAAVALMFTGCSDEGKWDAYVAEGETYSFAQGSSTQSYTAGKVPSEIKVELYRSTTTGSATLPVTFETESEVLSGPASVTFSEGSNMAEYVITVGEVPIGSSVAASVAFDENSVSPSGKSSFDLTVKVDYTWESAGTCVMYSDWAANQAAVPVQKAAEYNGNLYRLNSPYYYLEPSYCPNPGYHIQFYLDDSYEPLDLPRFQNIGETSSNGGYWNFYYNKDASYCSFTREGTVFTILGAWAYGPVGGQYFLSYYATEIFDWVEGCPSK